MSTFSNLKTEFQAFDVLPVTEQTSDQRKSIVRALESRVKANDVALTEAQFRECRDGSSSLGRILAYLLAENERIKSGLADRRTFVTSEWERLQWNGFAPDSSTMPLHYAVRSYLTSLKNAPEAAAGADVDRKLFDQIEGGLVKNGLDKGGQVQRNIGEIRSLVDERARSQTTAPILAARITRRGTIAAALITALVAFTVGLLTNWDKVAKWWNQQRAGVEIQKPNP